MRKFLIMSAVVLGMAALTTTEVKAGVPEGGDTDFHEPRPPRPPAGTHPYPGGPTPWDWKPWQNPIPN
ncbi:hypothetical protein [Sphingobacterium griseoflavum]|uniref:Uncharacterized protein n=1 Tax=Sphingobacterium griseoflavum TaxID=1474952 RepID=A0ABQ3HXU8_9SPHI|nr:hypothetical protein [Sphingobacterium griseoflavum]GHE35021.1 hypothetical protein GCM10017764_17780 [Sphingobacterium griseoflavum]